MFIFHLNVVFTMNFLKMAPIQVRFSPLRSRISRRSIFSGMILELKRSSSPESHFQGDKLKLLQRVQSPENTALASLDFGADDPVEF
jgi:hypothetical protein